MSQIIKNCKTVYTISGSQPLYVYSDYDKLLMEVTKKEIDEKSSIVKRGFRKFLGEDKFCVSRISGEEQIEEVSRSADNVIIDLSLGENCLIGSKNESQDFEAGLVIGTYPDLTSGQYYGPSRTELPKFAISMFAKKFGETSIDNLQEELSLPEEHTDNLSSINDDILQMLTDKSLSNATINDELSSNLEQ